MEAVTSHSRRLRFSLRTVFVAVTVACSLALFAGWYFQTPKVQVNGKLSRSDVAAICHVIETSSQLSEKRILWINVKAPDEVEVWTGEVRGPLDGGGEAATLNKANGVWVITDVAYWLS